MADLKNCRSCGKVFGYVGGTSICPACREADEADFAAVKDYLYDNRGASLSQVSTDLEVSVEKIKRYLKEGRLEIIGETPNLFLECESCGRSIKTGRFCNECEISLAAALKNTSKALESKFGRTKSESREKDLGLKYLKKHQ